MTHGLRLPRAGGGLPLVPLAVALLSVAPLAAGCGPDGRSGAASSEEDRRVIGSRAAAASVPASREAPHGQELPEGVTRATIQTGERIFSGEGFCHNCHGRDARGIRNLGSDLTDDRWEHTDGSFGDLVRVVGEGVKAERTASGFPMPPRGGARLDDEQLRAVAAYVWTLSR